MIPAAVSGPGSSTTPWCSATAGPEPEVMIEATYGAYWVVDLLGDQGANVHLAYPMGNN